MVDSGCGGHPCPDSPTFLDIFAKYQGFVAFHAKYDTISRGSALRDIKRSG